MRLTSFRLSANKRKASWQGITSPVFPRQRRESRTGKRITPVSSNCFSKASVKEGFLVSPDALTEEIGGVFPFSFLFSFSVF